MTSVHLADDLELALDSAEAPRLSRSDVPRELLAPADSRTLVRMTIEEWTIIAGLWAAIALAPWWAYLILVLPLAGRFHALGVILHDATHMPLRRKTIGIRFVEALSGYPIASTLNAMRYHHLRHHRDSGMPADPYYKAGRQNVWWWTLNIARGLVLVPFWSIRAIVGAVASFFPPVRNIYAHVFMQDRTRDDLRESPEVIECARAEWGQVAWQAGVVAIAVFYPSAVLWGYVVPVTIAGVLAARRVLIEHTYERVANRQVETIIATTNDNHLGVAGALGLAPRTIGYHIVHHIHPQVALGALPALRAWYVRSHPESYPPPRR